MHHSCDILVKVGDACYPHVFSADLAFEQRQLLSSAGEVATNLTELRG